jgi:hypothetical protein
MKKSSLNKYTDDELYAELNRRKAKSEAVKAKTLNINGITVKDFVVSYCDEYASPEDKEYNPFFSFYIKHKGKEYCIYYDYNEEDSKQKKWWPIVQESGYGGDIDANGAFNFIPKGFAEAMENAYEYVGKRGLSGKEKLEAGIKYLKECGFETITNIQREQVTNG